MKNNKIKQITIIIILLTVAILLAYGLYQKSQPNKQTDISEDNQETIDVNVGEIEKDVTVKIPDIKIVESNGEKEDNAPEVVKVEVDKPVVPPNPEPPKEESNDKSDIAKGEPIPSDEDVTKQGDEEENLDPPTYEEITKVEEEPIENPVIVTPDAPKDTSDDNSSSLVPDSENPFLKPPSEIPTNGDRGGVDGTEHSDYIPNTGDKF